MMLNIKNSLIALFLLALSTTSFAAKPIGAACMVDGQCTSGECRGFKCIAINENAQLTGNKKINGALSKFKLIEPMLLSAGFKVEPVIKIKLKLIPKVTVYIKQIKKLSKVEQTKVLKGYKGNIYFTTLLKSLFTAHNFKFNDYVVDQAVVGLIPPSVELELKRK